MYVAIDNQRQREREGKRGRLSLRSKVSQVGEKSKVSQVREEKRDAGVLASPPSEAALTAGGDTHVESCV